MISFRSRSKLIVPYVTIPYIQLISGSIHVNHAIILLSSTCTVATINVVSAFSCLLWLFCRHYVVITLSSQATKTVIPTYLLLTQQYVVRSRKFHGRPFAIIMQQQHPRRYPPILPSGPLPTPESAISRRQRPGACVHCRKSKTKVTSFDLFQHPISTQCTYGVSFLLSLHFSLHNYLFLFLLFMFSLFMFSLSIFF